MAADFKFFPNEPIFVKHLNNYKKNSDFLNTRKTSFFWLGVNTNTRDILNVFPPPPATPPATPPPPPTPIPCDSRKNKGRFLGENMAKREISHVKNNIKRGLGKFVLSAGSTDAVVDADGVTILVFPASSPFEIMTAEELIELFLTP